MKLSHALIASVREAGQYCFEHGIEPADVQPLAPCMAWQLAWLKRYEREAHGLAISAAAVKH